MSRVPLKEVRRFCIDCMRAVGTPKSHAVALADVLVEADKRGYSGHGLNRLDRYVRDVKSGLTDGKAKPCIIQESVSTAWVDGNNGLGPVVGNFCMSLAINKAQETGIGCVVAKGSNHCGILGWYCAQALQHNMIGLALTNTSPVMSPTRSKVPALGSNPVGFAAPGVEEDNFYLDISTTAVAIGNIELHFKLKEPIPLGWAQGPDGKPTTDAELALKTAALMPLGGEEKTSGYKGFGLAMLVETLCGILGGGDYGPNIRNWANPTKQANLGHCFIALKVSCFAPGFESRLKDLMCTLRCLEPTDPDKPVLVPGDLERTRRQEVEAAGGVLFHEKRMKLFAELAEQLKVKPLVPLEIKDC